MTFEESKTNLKKMINDWIDKHVDRTQVNSCCVDISIQTIKGSESKTERFEKHAIILGDKRD